MSAQGNPEDIRVERIQSSGNSVDNTRFEQASIAAAKQWTYRPEVVGGHAMASVVRVTVTFCMDGPLCRSPEHDADGRVSAPAPGSVATLDRHAKLVTQVAGSTF